MNLSVLIFLTLLLSIVIFMKRLGIGSMVAFLISGIIIGPHVMEIFQNSSAWTHLGKIGEMFLWFMLGLELNIKRLWTMRKNIFGFGAIQVLVIASFLFPFIFGFINWTMMGSIMICLMLTMSSTSSDLQILADRNELQSGLGRQTFSIILFQNLLVVPLLAMLPVFSGNIPNFGGTAIDIAVMASVLILGGAVFARFAMNPVMRIVSKIKSTEAFLLAMLIVIIGSSVLFHYIGMPEAVGAFIAGMLFSETVYNHQVRSDIVPYERLFVGLFYIAVGMNMNLSYLSENILIVFGCFAAFMFLKFIAIFMVARIRNVTTKNAFLMGLILVQGGEYGLLILQTLKNYGINIIPVAHIEILTAIIIISMITTPLLLKFYDKLNENIRLYSLSAANELNKEILPKDPAVIICGFGRVGITIAEMLKTKNIPYIAIDRNVDRVLLGREEKFNVFYGDTSSPDVLKEFGLNKRKTKAVIIALDNAATTKNSVRTVHRLTPKVKIFARARNLQESNILKSEGAYIALPETIESSFLLGRNALASTGIPEKEIELLLSRMRNNHYKAIEGILDQ